MVNRYALLVDGGFISKRLGSGLGRAPTLEEVLAECAKMRAHEALASLELLRIYYYDAPPATGKQKYPLGGGSLELGDTKQHKDRTAFLDKLALAPDVALRLGEVAVHGWKLRAGSLKELAKEGRALKREDLKPDIAQKGVDLRIGLDIARLSLKGLVGTIAIVTGDSDLIPAMKFARREGTRVYLLSMGAPVKPGLKAHADLVLS